MGILNQGLILMVTGMGAVFAFLVVLFYVVKAFEAIAPKICQPVLGRQAIVDGPHAGDRLVDGGDGGIAQEVRQHRVRPRGSEA